MVSEPRSNRVNANRRARPSFARGIISGREGFTTGLSSPVVVNWWFVLPHPCSSRDLGQKLQISSVVVLIVDFLCIHYVGGRAHRERHAREMADLEGGGL